MAKEKRNFVVTVIGEHETLYYGECTALTVPTNIDTITILPNHTPIIAKLGKGEVSIHNGHSKQTLAQIESGLLFVGDNEASVLINL